MSKSKTRKIGSFKFKTIQQSTIINYFSVSETKQLSLLFIINGLLETESLKLSPFG